MTGLQDERDGAKAHNPQGKTWSAALSYLLAASGAGAAHQSLTPDEILENSIEAMGGNLRFRGLRGAVLEHRLRPANSPPELVTRTRQEAVLPETMDMKVAQGGSQRIFRLSDGVVAVAEGEDRVSTFPNDDTAFGYRSFFWREWWVLYARRAWHGLGETIIKSEGVAIEGGEPFHVLLIAPRDAAAYRLNISNETWRPAMRKYSRNGQEFTDIFSEFKERDGLVHDIATAVFQECDL